ncbi:unnamed protein product [Bemisia tabaci]|uniref:Uncharacterized protein n=1 Tax=Bemisia tabaci TaxID=7038 RepID=A0A9P0AIP9_BEMTA|nr:unnamed protein product [Bemisia tabaci]
MVSVPVNFELKYQLRIVSLANHGACLVSSLSVRDIALNRYPASPCTSTMRCRDINQDMEALRISRQDNPFLQVLASRESLADSLEELESDDVNLMAQQEADVDPLTLPDIHQHMVRSPPPVSWPRSPIFRFDSSQAKFTIHKSGNCAHNSGLKNCDSLDFLQLSKLASLFQDEFPDERESSSQAMDLIGGLSGRKSDVR